MLPPPAGTAVVTLLAVTEVTVSGMPSPSESLVSTLPVTVPASFNVAESGVAVGRSGPEFTVIVNICDGELALGVPLSIAVTVTVAAPNALGAGVYVNVPFDPMLG